MKLAIFLMALGYAFGALAETSLPKVLIVVAHPDDDEETFRVFKLSGTEGLKKTSQFFEILNAKQ
jgi:hypothetical protein